MLIFFLLSLLIFLSITMLFHKPYLSFLISTFFLYIFFLLHTVFWSIPDDIYSLISNIDISHQTLNVILLIPFGFFLVELFKIRSYSLLLIISIILPFIIEIGQELLFEYNEMFKYHFFDMMDVKCNFLGCFISSFSTLFIRKQLLKNQQLSNIN